MKRYANKRHISRIPFNQAIALEIWEHGAEYLRQEGVGVDLSSDGGGLSTTYPLQRGDVVKILIPVGAMNLRLPVYALVAWSKACNGGFRAGVSFLV